MRPTKYSQDMLDKARDYLETYKDDGSVIPSIAGLALRLKIDRTTPYAWAEDPDKAEFSNILGAILAEQERLLLNNGLTGDFNSAIAKLVLGKHGYHDRVDNQITGKDGGAIKIDSAPDLSNLSKDELRQFKELLSKANATPVHD